MSLRLSKFGERFTRRTGALELMDDLGRAMSGEAAALMLGGGNPGRIPAVEQVFRQRLREICSNDEEYGRAFANYAHPQGENRFRRSLAKLLRSECGWPVDEDNIALTAGSQAGFFLLFNLFAGEGPDQSYRRILLPLTPEYVGYADLGLSENLFVSRKPTIQNLSDDLFKYRVDFNALQIDETIGAVCVSRPTNPTGNVITDNELDTLDQVCRSRGVPLIIDNAYGPPFPDIVFSDVEPKWNENIVYCMSLSKLGLPAARTGIVVARHEIIEALTRMTAILNLAVGSIGPRVVQPLLDSGEILRLSRDVIRPYYRERALHSAEWVREQLAGSVPFKIHKPEGAFFLWLWLPDFPVSNAELYKRLKAAGVLVLSGHYFFPGLAGEWAHKNECVRISFALDEGDVRKGIGRVGAVIKEIAAAGGASRMAQ